MSGDDHAGEGGHMSSRFGRIVRTSDFALPYTAILTHDECAETKRSFATMRIGTLQKPSRSPTSTYLPVLPA